MHAIAPPDGTEAAIQTVYWTILIIFFVLATLSWLIASKEWFKEDAIRTETPKDQPKDQIDEPQNSAEQ